MATGAHTYFDHPADASVNEPGFYWAARFTDLIKIFSYRPFHFYNNADYHINGQVCTKETVCPPNNSVRCPVLTKPENIIGIQGVENQQK